MRAGITQIGSHAFSGTCQVLNYSGQTLANGLRSIPTVMQFGAQSVKWSLVTTGSLVKKTFGVTLMTVGYPLTAVSSVLSAASFILGSGPCYTSFFSFPSAFEQVFFPIKSTVLILEASTCPSLAAMTGIFLGITGGAYLTARTGYHLAVN